MPDMEDFNYIQFLGDRIEAVVGTIRPRPERQPLGGLYSLDLDSLERLYIGLYGPQSNPKRDYEKSKK
jgi:hypothetical protein